MQWLSKFFNPDTPAVCFLCASAITDGGADIKYAYDNSGKKEFSRVLICSGCANELEVGVNNPKKD